MDLHAVKQRLALLQAGGEDSDHNTVTGITGVKRAYAEAPQSIPESDMPLFVNLTGPTLSFMSLGANYYLESRQFNCRLFVATIQEGIDGEAERKVEPFIEPSMKRFLKARSLSNGNADDLIPGISAVRYLGDSGITVFTFNKQRFLGVEFRVAVDAVIEEEPGEFD